MTTTDAKRTRLRAGLTAKDVMETTVITVGPSSPLSEVERLLTEHRISGMPVTDSSGRAIGVVSYRDLLDHHAANPDARARGGPAYFRRPAEHQKEEDFDLLCFPEGSEATVADVMTPAIVDVSTDATMQEICRTMANHAVHRVLVTERGTGRMVGILSSLAVLAALADA